MATTDIDRGRQRALIAVTIIMTSLGTTSMIMRIISRFVVMRRLGADDWMMIIGLIFTIVYLFEIMYGLRFGIGLHTSDDSLPNMVSLLQIIFSIQLTYNTVITAIKISILCFYLRLVTLDRMLRKVIWGTIMVLAMFYVTSQLISTFQCTPVEKQWDLTGQVKGHCINTEVYFYFAAAFNIVADVWVLILPIKTLKNIKRPTRDKVVLFVVFGFGSLSCISSMIRLYTIRVFTDSDDPFYDGVPINIWSMVEINVAIICASVPAMKPLFSSYFRERSNLSRSGFSSRYAHQMTPLGDKDRKSHRYTAKATATVTASASATQHGTGSEEHIVPSAGEIGMAREFTVEESYVDVKGATASAHPNY